MYDTLSQLFQWKGNIQHVTNVSNRRLISYHTVLKRNNICFVWNLIELVYSYSVFTNHTHFAAFDMVAAAVSGVPCSLYRILKINKILLSMDTNNEV